MERDTDVIASPETTDQPGRGREAKLPTEIPTEGWKDVLARVRIEVKRDRVTLLSSAVAFHALLALVPALVAFVSLYGLIADASTVDRQVDDWLGTAPREVRELLTTQLKSITENAGAATGIAVVIGIVAALWSASSGIAHLIEATNIAYDEEETRGFVARRALPSALTSGRSAVHVVRLGADHRASGSTRRYRSRLVRQGPARDPALGPADPRHDAGPLGAVPLRTRPRQPRWSWTSPGALLATVLWVIAVHGFAVYTANFGKYNETYGSLGAVVVLMLWLYFTVLCVILGAELNARARTTDRAATPRKGPPKPLGSRDAEVADTIGATAEELDRRSQSVRH